MSATILVVDDDPVQRRLLTANIERLGYSAVAVDGGEAALRHLAGAGTEGDAVALIILDLMMPDIDGMAVLARLRELDRTTPVIVQTVRSGTETVVDAMRAGAVDFMAKPVAPERLQVSIENALKRGALEGELARMKRAVAPAIFTSFVDELKFASRITAVFQGLKMASCDFKRFRWYQIENRYR
jgi:DNA-binding NtrC family response regulator